LCIAEVDLALAFLSSPDDPHAGERNLQPLSQLRLVTFPAVKGLSFCNAAEQVLLRTLQRGEFNIGG
jgi:hypothetical protein